MRTFTAFVVMFIRDLVRRRMVWVILFVIIAMLGLNELMRSVMEQSLESGDSYDIATRKAVSGLERIGLSIRQWLPIAVALIALQLAPESRKNGTTQFVLSLGVSRIRVALAQYAALCVFLLSIVLIVHVGYCISGFRIGAVTAAEFAGAWLTLTGSVLVLAAVVHALAMTLSGVEVVLVLFVVPLFAAMFPQLTSTLKIEANWLVVMLDNVNLFYPNPNALVTWPHLAFKANVQWQWPLIHRIFAASFWLLFGYWLLRYHDFGSRTAAK